MIVTELTQRALRDIKAIDTYSVQTFGERRADRYIADLQDAIALVSENPGLLQTIPEVSNRLSFYRAQRHRLVCIVYLQRIYVSMILHAQMDLHSRIAELEPQLIREAEMLYRRVREKKSE